MAPASLRSLKKSLEKATQKMAPLWPLENFVAVNPYLGLSHLSFHEAAQRLAKVGGGRMTQPADFYMEALEQDRMRHADVSHALETNKGIGVPRVEQFLKNIDLKEKGNFLPEVASLTDVATRVSGQDWNQWTLDYISSWASVYFDQKQVAWNTTFPIGGLFSAWKQEAQVNRTPDVHGLKWFRSTLADFPNNPLEAAYHALHMLGLPTVGIDLYLHRMLMRVQGWACYAAYLDWQQKLYQDTEGNTQVEFLVVLLCAEAALWQCLQRHKPLPQLWEENLRSLLHLDVEESVDTSVTERLVLQDAYDRASQRSIMQQFPAPLSLQTYQKPRAQAVFCIDVRSEVYRRHLERASPEMETLGFAGFFAFPVHYQPLGHSQGRAQCPVLLPAGPTVTEGLRNPRAQQQAVTRRQTVHQVGRAWKAFKKGAVTCFGYVSPLGLSFLPKLISDSLGITRPVAHPDEEGLTAAQRKQKTIHLAAAGSGLDVEKQVALAKGALRAMSLTEGFGRLVLIVGHGANTVNNPHATGLDCGACGGNAGEANARVAVTVLNSPVVREHLIREGILVPETTWFVAAQHDTTTDEVTLFEVDAIPTSHQQDLKEVQGWLKQASQGARAERAHRLGVHPKADVEAAVKGRSHDWAQVRPEWGLAGCHVFVVAPRKRTYGLNLEGSSFLHSYTWQQDEGFKVLELIMTAPMIVTSWINLQYYASSVDNERYGAGNKTLHNVTAGLGVLEGSAGDLRTGLPLQSVHDGHDFQHKPVRLNVVIEAPIEAMNDIISRHDNVRQPLDHQWIFLWVMDNNGCPTHRYAKGLRWEEADL